MRNETVNKTKPDYDAMFIFGILVSAAFIAFGGKFFVPYGATLGMLVVLGWFLVVD